jgi:beta-lactamase regulating signal transducer with metallopeptidase domain
MSRFSIDWSELSLQVMVAFGHFLWQACVIGFVLFVAQHVGESLRDSQILRHRRSTKSNVSPGETDLRGANLRYAFACLAFFSLPICVVATFAMVHQSRGSIFLATNNPIETLAIPTASENRSNSPLTSNSVEGLGSPEMLADPLLTSRAQIPLVEPIDKPDPWSPGTTWVELAQSNAPYLLIAYAIGVALMLTRFGISIMGSSRLHRTLQPIADSNLLKIIAAQSSRLGLKRVPIVAICQRVSVPVVVGIVKPMILLPPALLCGLDPNQIAAILSHEMAHIRRYDLIVNLLQRIVEALLFFHPVTWWISRSMSIERENCCDDVAAACTGRLSYASALLQMAELCVSNDRRRRTALTALSADGGNTTEFGDRIRRLINAGETTRVGVTLRSFAVGLTILSLLTASLVAWGQNGKSAGEKPDDESMSKIFNPEPLWQTKLTADDAASEMSRVSPVVVATDRVLSIGHDFDLQTGKLVPNPFARLPRTYEFEVTVDPVFRRRSSDRAFIVEALNRAPGNTWSMPSYDLRVLRASDGSQVGVTVTIAGHFNWSACDVDVENGGDFLLLGSGNEVRVYRTETGQVETTMPVKIKRVDAVAISPDRKWLVVSDQNDLHFWQWRDQAPVKTIHVGRKIDSLVFTPDGQYLAEGPDFREDIQIRDMLTLEVIASLKDEVGSPLMVSSMDITPDGRYLVAHNEASVDQKKLAIPHQIHVWDLQSRGKPVFQIATGEWVRNVAFSDDGRMIVGEFSGAAHGALLAAWQLPNEMIQRRMDSPRDAKDRLGDGIQWSRFGDENGLLSGARLILPAGGLQPGQPLVVEYRLANVSKEKKTLKCYLNKGMQFTSLSNDSRIGGFGLDWHREPVTLNIEPREVFIDTEHLVSIDTTGLEPGRYHVALGSAFRYPDSVEPQTTHHISHFGSIPFMIDGESAARFVELPKSEIHWGKPIAGMQVGARFAGDPTAITTGTTIEADLFVANVTDHPIECSVVLPHPQDGWLFNVEDQPGHTIMLQRPMRFSSPFPQQYIQLKLAPGEITALTGEQDKQDGKPSRPRAKFEVAKTKIDEQSWSDYTIKGRLVTLGGQYSAIFDVTLLRPEIPALRLELDTGNVPFKVVDRGLSPGKLNGRITVASQQSGDQKSRSSKQSFKLIDGETGNPLQGLKCQAIIAKLNASPRYQACTTDEHGVVEVVVAEDESAGIAEVPSGWFSVGVGSIYAVQVPESEQQPQQNTERKNEEPTLLKLWRGTEVDGRLLWPDKTPAAGVKLTAGVYINNQSWKEKLGMDLNWYSFDHGDWPNWSRTIVTDDDGNFRVTVPPKDARFWLRIGTTQLGFSPQTGAGEDEAVSQRLAKCVPLEIQYGGSSRSNELIVYDITENNDMVFHAGDLQLVTGVIVRGRVVDADGKGLSNVRLTSTGPHGPHSGRSATSGENGKFEFPAMAAGNLTVHPDARLRDVTKPIPEQVISRDVQAVFVDQSFTIPSVFLPHEITVRAVPHTEVTFDWVDRRADKSQPIAFYGAFRVRGYLPDENGKPATYWTSETERIERNGKQWLTVKIPAQLLKPELMLVADSKVTASYSDSTGVNSGPGIVELGDITADTTRTIFGDEPREPAGGANVKVEPWEISKLYEAAFLRTYLQDHETLPKPIVVPSISGKVFDPDGKPASGVRIVSHTPRHWVDLDATLTLKPHNSGGVRKSKQNGIFGLPERTEPYRVLLVHESGVANVSHEELLRANGIVKLQKWASVSGTLKLGGKPQAGETIVLHFDTLPWSYSRGGPRLTTTHRSTTDKDGNFSFDRVPPLGGMAYHVSRAGSLGHGAVYQCESGKNTHIEIGAGITVTGSRIQEK